jgi:two-component system OmpR family sensor kinase
MSLRTRLVASLALTLAVALVLAGFALVELTRQSLVNRVDQELATAANGPEHFGRLQDLTGEGAAGRRLAIMQLDRQGAVQRSFPSGFASDPDPLPALPRYPTGVPASAFGRIETRSSADGTIDYRVIMGQGRGGAAIAVAAPLTGVDAATATLVRTLLAVGGVAIVVLTLISFAIVRRGLLPLERLERAARQISAGDLGHRTGIPHDASEVGRVGAAFDAMIDQIEASFATQQAALEAKARSEERLRRFVADASHELRTPLTAVRGYAELYRAGGLADPDELDAAMDRIGTEGRRMARLVDDLLLLARLDQGAPLRADRVDLSRVVREAVADARAVEPARPISADVDDGVLVRGDDDRIRQVIGNLLSNARVHSRPDAPVDVALHAIPDEAVEVRVVDHGAGIDPADSARVFDRFYRADPGRSRDRGGSGLGLSIVASIADALGGRVWHEATPGGGATFVVRLPLTGHSQPDPGTSPAIAAIVSSSSLAVVARPRQPRRHS